MILTGGDDTVGFDNPAIIVKLIHMIENTTRDFHGSNTYSGTWLYVINPALSILEVKGFVNERK
jgi:hypothetical protein